MARKRKIFFTEELIDEIKNLYNQGITYNKIISKLELNCCRDTLVKYLNSKTKENYHDLYELVFSRENSELFSDWLYKDATIYLDRKYERYKLFKKYNFKIPYTELKIGEVFGIFS